MRLARSARWLFRRWFRDVAALRLACGRILCNIFTNRRWSTLHNTAAAGTIPECGNRRKTVTSFSTLSAKVFPCGVSLASGNVRRASCSNSRCVPNDGNCWPSSAANVPALVAPANVHASASRKPDRRKTCQVFVSKTSPFDPKLESPPVDRDLSPSAITNRRPRGAVNFADFQIFRLAA